MLSVYERDAGPDVLPGKDELRVLTPLCLHGLQASARCLPRGSATVPEVSGGELRVKPLDFSQQLRLFLSGNVFSCTLMWHELPNACLSILLRASVFQLYNFLLFLTTSMHINNCTSILYTYTGFDMTCMICDK